MKETIAYTFLCTYTILEFVAYIPQIVKILKTKYADDLSLTAWFVWIATDLSYLSYVLLETPQIGLLLIATLDLMFVLSMLLLTAYYQKHHKRRKNCR